MQTIASLTSADHSDLILRVEKPFYERYILRLQFCRIAGRVARVALDGPCLSLPCASLYHSCAIQTYTPIRASVAPRDHLFVAGRRGRSVGFCHVDSGANRSAAIWCDAFRLAESGLEFFRGSASIVVTEATKHVARCGRLPQKFLFPNAPIDESTTQQHSLPARTHRSKASNWRRRGAMQLLYIVSRTNAGPRLAETRKAAARGIGVEKLCGSRVFVE